MRDFTSEANPRPVIQAAAAGLFPDEITALPLITSDSLGDLAKSAFADPENRLLPVHTAQAVLFSASYVAAHPDFYPAATADRVKAAASVFGLAKETEAILGAEIFAALKIKEAAAADHRAFALSIEDGTPFNLGAGPREFLPIHDQWHIEQSSDSLMKSAAADTMPADLFYVAAVNMVKAAKSQDCVDALPKIIVDLGTERVADWEKAAHLLEDRRRYVCDEEFAHYGEILKVAREHPELVEEVIDGIRDLDTAFGIPYRWNNKSATAVPCKSPWEVVYCGLTMDEIEKMASTHCVIAGALVPLEVLAAVPDTTIERSFAKVASEVIRAAKVQDSVTATATLGALGDDVQARLFEVLAA